jgi:hypothetical protein
MVLIGGRKAAGLRAVFPGSWRKVSKVKKNTGGLSDEDQESQRSDGAP